eukprot:7385396-Prymnesium_polylepis.1
MIASKPTTREVACTPCGATKRGTQTLAPLNATSGSTEVLTRKPRTTPPGSRKLCWWIVFATPCTSFRISTHHTGNEHSWRHERARPHRPACRCTVQRDVGCVAVVRSHVGGGAFCRACACDN